MRTSSPSQRPDRYRINANSPLLDGLVFAGFGGNGCIGSGILRDESIYGNHGVLNGMSFPSTATSGWGWDGRIRRPILRFDGSNDYVKSTNSAQFHGAAGFTISAWVFWNSIGGTADALFSKTSAAGYVAWWLFTYDNASDNIAFQAGGILRISSNNAATVGLHHLLVTYDGSGAGTGVRFYVDGVEPGYTTTSSNPYSAENNDAYFTIGNRLTGDRPFDGWMADVCMWSGEKRWLLPIVSDPANVDLRAGTTPLLTSVREWWPVASATMQRKKRFLTGSAW